MSGGKFLLDTNIVSELRRKRPDPQVMAWFAGVRDENLYLSVLSVGEIRRGVERLKLESQRLGVTEWLEGILLPWFGPRLLPVNLPVAECWGRLSAAAGRPLPAIDSLLAATAMSHDLTMVTRNVIDFKLSSLRVINPWNEPLAG